MAADISHKTFQTHPLSKGLLASPGMQVINTAHFNTNTPKWDKAIFSIFGPNPCWSMEHVWAPQTSGCSVAPSKPQTRLLLAHKHCKKQVNLILRVCWTARSITAELTTKMRKMALFMALGHSLTSARRWSSRTHLQWLWWPLLDMKCVHVTKSRWREASMALVLHSCTELQSLFLL